MPARVAESPENQALREVTEEDDAAVKALVAEAGPPPGATTLSEADEDEAWETTDPLVDDEQMPTMLMTQGLPPEMIQQLHIFKYKPEWAQLYQQPTQSAEMADQLTRIAKWPFRWTLLEDYDDPDEMTKKAEALDRRYQRRMTQMQEAMAAPGTLRTTTGYRGMEGA